MTIFAAGSVPVSGMTCAGQTPLRGALCVAVLAHSIRAATDSTGATFSAACFSVIMFFTPLIAHSTYVITQQTSPEIYWTKVSEPSRTPTNTIFQ